MSQIFPMSAAAAERRLKAIKSAIRGRTLPPGIPAATAELVPAGRDRFYIKEVRYSSISHHGRTRSPIHKKTEGICATIVMHGARRAKAAPTPSYPRMLKKKQPTPLPRVLNAS